MLIAIATNVGSAEVKIDACACHSSFTGKLGAPVKEWLSSGHAKSKIICADCHANETYMKKYDLEPNQYM